MTIIKLDAIDSTNSYLKKLSVERKLDDYTIVTTKEQTSGRGQMGTVWSSEPSKNLTFSIYNSISYITKDKQFYLSMAVSLSVLNALQILGIPNLKIKWPNDILSADLKICGILIENIIKQHKLYASIIGVGLNVNQTAFEELPNVSSMKLLTGKHFNHEEVLHHIIDQIKKYDELLKKGNFNLLSQEYQLNLFRINKPSTFQNNKEELFMGFIKGVSLSGKLQVLLENNILAEYNLKEIKLLY